MAGAVQGVSQREQEARRSERQQRPTSFSPNDEGTVGRVPREESRGRHTLTWHPCRASVPFGSALEFPSYNRYH